MKKTVIYYLESLVALAVLSAYPLVNGARMAYLSLQNGALEPDEYVQYIVPYAAICVAILLFSASYPLLLKLERLALPVGIAMAYGAFFAVERFFESIKIHVAVVSLTSITPEINTVNAVDWQSLLCAVTPEIQGQSNYFVSAAQDIYMSPVSSEGYMAHYYLISIVLIAMACFLIHGVAKWLRNDDESLVKPLTLRGICTAALISICVFANTTSFFRQSAPIQTPIASMLTGMFFVVLGAAAGVYAASYLLGKGKPLGMATPVLLAMCVTVLMYAGEAAIMNGKLYRFGEGWFFVGLPVVMLAPVDVVIVLLSGVLTWLAVNAARKREHWPAKRLVLAALALCVTVVATGFLIAR